MMLDAIPYWIRMWFRGISIAAITLTAVAVFGDFYPPLHESDTGALFWMAVFAKMLTIDAFGVFYLLADMGVDLGEGK